MKIILIVAILLNSTLSFAQKIAVSENNRFLVKDGKPFVWIGDTAWELFHKLDREDASDYLQNRKEKDFTIIQAVILAENDGLRKPNSYGHKPLIDYDPAQPNEKYFEHVDFIVDKARELGLVMGILPTWGDKLATKNPGAGPEVFTPENAAIFGEFLGKRYHDHPVVWILGGDRNVDSRENFEIWEAMAKGIRKGDRGKHLIGYHPRGSATSSYWFHDEPWLDFNMYQSGHADHYNPVYNYAEREYMLQPVKPFIDGEPAYEDISVRFWDYMDFSKYSNQRVPEGVLDEEGVIRDKSHFEAGFFDDYDMRVHAYWNFLAGACGYTYGNNAIWQMFKKGGEIAIPALTDWREAMDRPGAKDMTHVRALFESRSLAKLIPDQSIIYGQNPDNEYHLRAAKASDGSYLLIYLAVGQPVTVKMNNLQAEKARAWWYNPREGTAKEIGIFATAGIQQFEPPATGARNDWVLVLDDAAANQEAPGTW
jgi:hypothetical protein